jgi:hypothetical protein
MALTKETIGSPPIHGSIPSLLSPNTQHASLSVPCAASGLLHLKLKETQLQN